MLYYQVNNQQFYNPYLAQHESYTSGQPVKFYCYDNEYDLLDWTKEPEQSFEELMDAHALHLRSKYDRLIMTWSGGTDSQTMYNVFKRNKIHINEIINIYANKYEEHFPYNHFKWLNENHWDPTTKITGIDRFDLAARKKTLKSEDWIFRNESLQIKFGIPFIGDTIIEHIEKNHNGYNWGLVTGLEKPFVFCKNNRWYTHQKDSLLLQAFGRPKVECFYLNPILHLKQSHLAKNVLKKLQAIGKCTDAKSYYKSIYSEGLINNYYTWAQEVGRHKELVFGTSFAQKDSIAHLTSKTKLNSDKFENFALTNEISLATALHENNDTALTFIKGWYSMKSESGFYDFLNRNYFQEKDAVINPKLIFSKAYDLGK